MDEIRIAICDDEEKWRRSVCELCNMYMKEHDVSFRIDQYTGGADIPDKMEADILFLDVEMEGESGIDVKNRLCRSKTDIRMVFITSHKETMPDAFGRNVYGFISKPIVKECFDSKMDLLMDEINDENKTIMLNSSGKCKVFRLNDVMYIKADGRYSYIYAEGESPAFSDKGIGFWNSYLGSSDFVFSERSILVNLRHVKQIEKTYVLVRDGAKLELSRRMKNDFNEAHKKYIWKKGY